jgi:hypothetical protein
LTVRFLPTLYILLAILVVFCFGRIWLRSDYGAVLMAVLVIFGEDFSFVPGLLLQSSKVCWSYQYFQMPSTLSLFYMNPMLPALAMLYGGLYCLVRFCQEGGRFWGLLTAALFVIEWQLKVFASVQEWLALTATSLVFWVVFRNKRLAQLWALTTIMFMPLVLSTFSLNSTQVIRLEPFPYILEACRQTGLGDTWLGNQMTALFERRIINMADLAVLVSLALPGFLVGALGLRVFAIPSMLKDLFSPRSMKAERFFMAAFVLVGVLLTLVFTVDSEIKYNNSVWFFVLSKYVAWVFFVELVVSFLRGKRRLLQAAVVSAVIGLSVPSTVQYFAYMRSVGFPSAYSHDTVGLLDFLGQTCSGGEIVFWHDKLARFVPALTKCRVPLADVFAASFTPRAELNRRANDQSDFWLAETSDQARKKILSRYNVDYVIAAKNAVVELGQPDYLSPIPVFENREYVVYLTQKDRL